jgi:hypothetical protein
LTDEFPGAGHRGFDLKVDQYKYPVITRDIGSVYATSAPAPISTASFSSLPV